MGNVLQGKAESFISKVRILYINSNPEICEKLLRIVNTSQLITVETVHGWRKAFDEFSIDIVIMNIKEGITELHAVEEIHALDPYLPIIVITDNNDEAFFLSLIAIGIDRYIKYPVADDDLYDAVTSAVYSVQHRKEMEAKNDFILALLDISPSMLAILKDGIVTYLNKTFKEYLNVNSIDEFYSVYKSLVSIILNRDPNIKDDKALEIWANNNASGADGSRMVQLTLPGSYEPQSFLFTSVPVPGENDSYLLSFTDITNFEKEKQQYQYLAEYDALTKIFNRAKINKELDKEIVRVLRYGQRLSALMIDVDHFKNVNDTYGHHVGDVVLTELASLLQDKIRKTDILGRYGGEEFIILMPSTSIDSAYSIAERIRVYISKFAFFVIGKITCSIGVAEYQRGESAVSFVKRADDALYVAKRNGRNKVEVKYN